MLRCSGVAEELSLGIGFQWLLAAGQASMYVKGIFQHWMISIDGEYL
jgi:hypothetical protein